jgi:hypothetical protein
MIRELELSSQHEWKFFSSPPCPDQLWGPFSLLSTGMEAFSLEVKHPGCDINHSYPSNAKD